MAIVDTGLKTKGAKSEFFERFNATPSYFGELSTHIQSTADREQYRFLGAAQQLREWGTGRLARGLFDERYDVDNLEYEATLEVDRKELDDDQTGQIRLRIGELASVAATHKDYLISQLLINGNQAGFVGYDSVSFFSSAHPTKQGGATQDNTMSVDVTTPTDPTVVEFKSALRLAMQRMMTFKNDQNESLRIGPTGMAVVVPAGLYFTALEAINATVINNTSNVLAGAAKVLPLPDITAGDVFYLLKTDVPIRPFIFQERQATEFTAIADGSEEEFKRGKHLYGVRARYRMAYGRWAYAVRVLFT